jgi:hypothetical protein
VEIIWFFGEKQPLHESIKNSLHVPIKFEEGLPNLNEVAPEPSAPPRLLVIDDLMSESNSSIVDLFS